MKQNGTLGCTIGKNGTYQQRTCGMYRHSLHKAGGKIRLWNGSELDRDDAAQGTAASGSAHVWRPCMPTQNTGRRPGKRFKLDSESVGPLACPATEVTGTLVVVTVLRY